MCVRVYKKRCEPVIPKKKIKKNGIWSNQHVVKKYNFFNFFWDNNNNHNLNRELMSDGLLCGSVHSSYKYPLEIFGNKKIMIISLFLMWIILALNRDFTFSSFSSTSSSSYFTCSAHFHFNLSLMIDTRRE